MILLEENPRVLIRYALASATLTGVVFWILYLSRDAVLLIYISVLISIGLGPLVNAVEKADVVSKDGEEGTVQRRWKFTRWYRLPRWGAILSIYLVLLSIMVGISVAVLPPLMSQARELWVRLPSLINRAQQFLVEIGLLDQELTFRQAVEQAPTIPPDAIGTVLTAVWSVVGGVFGIITILILTFYLLLDADNLVATFVRLFPKNKRDRVAEACRRVSVKVSAWLGGQLLLAGIIGTTAALALWLIGVPYFFVLALIAAIGEMIPLVGPVLAAVPAILVSLTISPAVAVGVTIFFVVQQQFESHVLVPKIMERQVGISAVVVVLALVIGLSVFGIVGAILAVPTAAVLQVIFREFTPLGDNE